MCPRGGRPQILTLDVTAPDAGERALEACLAAFGASTRWSTMPARSAVRSLEQLTDDDWQAQWELHVIGPDAADARAGARDGAGVDGAGSSTSARPPGKRPSGTNMAYSVTKAAQLSLSRAFADLYAGRGVLVNAVAPGPVGNELWLAHGGLADQTAAARGITREEVLEAAPIATCLWAGWPEADEIAAVIVFLCSRARLERGRCRLVGRRRLRARDHLTEAYESSAPMAVEHRRNRQDLRAVTYAVGREKIREYASAVGETDPLYLDVEAARAAGYDDVVAPPMFAVVYAGRAVIPALFDPEVGINFAMLVHAGQEFRWGPVVVAGDEIAHDGRVKDVSERAASASSYSSRSPQPARRDRLHGHVDEHREGGRMRDRGRLDRAAGHPRPVRDGALRRRLGRLQPDPHRRAVRPAGRAARADPPRSVDDGPGGPGPHRGGWWPGEPASFVGSVPGDGTAGQEIVGHGTVREATGRPRSSSPRPSRPASGSSATPGRGSSPDLGRSPGRSARPSYNQLVLTDRQELVLRKVVEEYLDAGSPVGSKALAADVEWGPSTIRHELANLEELGLLAHPHTSAGRVPTEAGYRYFVDRLLPTERPRAAPVPVAGPPRAR